MSIRIDPIDDDQVSPEIKQYFNTAEQRGAPNSTFLRILARDPNSVKVFYQAWDDIFYGGRLDHGLKEIIRVRMARLRNCGY